MRFTVAAAVLLRSLAVGASSLGAQASSASAGVTTAAAPAYDVVSIKPDKSTSGHVSISINDDIYSATNVSLKQLLASAYTIQEELIFDLPKWANGAAYDIEAKMLDPDRAALEKLTGEQWGALLQPILADRFALKAHTETRTLPIYTLTVLKGGPSFKLAVPRKGPTGITIHNANLTATSVSMDKFASRLSQILHRTVNDQTGLAGNYDLQLTWTSPYAVNSSEEDSEASLITALREQLGLELRSSKGPVNTLVVDHIEPPSPN